MILFASIFLSIMLGYILLHLNVIGIVIAAGIITGSLFYGIYLLLLINDKLTRISKHLNIKESVHKDWVSDEEIEKELDNSVGK